MDGTRLKLLEMEAQLNGRVEALLAKPYPTRADLEKHCELARAEGYRAIVVPTSLAERAYELLDGSDLKLCCAVGFPFGSSDPDVKRFETEVAVDFGAHEIELIPTLSRVLEEDYKGILREIRDVVEAADERPVKVAIESHLWNQEQLKNITEMLLDSGAQFLSTSIALQGRHASAEAVALLRELVGDSFGLKVGGFKTLDGADELVAAGVNRLGLSI